MVGKLHFKGGDPEKIMVEINIRESNLISPMRIQNQIHLGQLFLYSYPKEEAQLLRTTTRVHVREIMVEGTIHPILKRDPIIKILDSVTHYAKVLLLIMVLGICHKQNIWDPLL